MTAYLSQVHRGSGCVGTSELASTEARIAVVSTTHFLPPQSAETCELQFKRTYLPRRKNCGVSMRKSAEGKEQNDKRRRDEDCIFLRSSQGCVSATPGRSPQSTQSALRLARIPFNNDVQPSIRSIPILLCTAQTIHPNPRSRWVWKDGVIRTRQGD